MRLVRGQALLICGLALATLLSGCAPSLINVHGSLPQPPPSCTVKAPMPAPPDMRDMATIKAAHPCKWAVCYDAENWNKLQTGINRLKAYVAATQSR